jgi:DNA-binding MarR family transcriptional regulator
MLTTELTPERCATEIMRVIPKVIRFLRSEMRQQGQPSLSLSQLRVLKFLERSPHASLSEVADYLDVTRPTMSTMIDRLVQRGLVARTADPQERRRVLLTLTTAGQTQLQQVSQATEANVVEVLAHLSTPQLQQLLQGVMLLDEVFAEKVM